MFAGWWIEIASMEHPRLLRAAIEEADRLGVTLGRVSTGSGLQFLTDGELDELLGLAHERDIEVYCYHTSRNSFEPVEVPGAAEALRGEIAFRDALDEIVTYATRGVDGVLVADLGLLAAAGELRRDGALSDLGLKAAAAIAPHNAAAAAALVGLGATSINVPTTASREDLLAMRQSVGEGVSLDIYVEAPDALGGGVRYRDVAFMVGQLQPVSVKVGLRNAPSLYPYGQHLEPTAERTIREKVRRARLVLTCLERSGLGDAQQGRKLVADGDHRGPREEGSHGQMG